MLADGNASELAWQLAAELAEAYVYFRFSVHFHLASPGALLRLKTCVTKRAIRAHVHRISDGSILSEEKLVDANFRSIYQSSQDEISLNKIKIKIKILSRGPRPGCEF
jgi:hypothetical protein